MEWPNKNEQENDLQYQTVPWWILESPISGMWGWIPELWASFLRGYDEIQVLLFILNETFVGVCYLLDLGNSRYQEIRVIKSVGHFGFVDRLFLQTVILLYVIKPKSCVSPLVQSRIHCKILTSRKESGRCMKPFGPIEEDGKTELIEGTRVWSNCPAKELLRNGTAWK